MFRYGCPEENRCLLLGVRLPRTKLHRGPAGHESTISPDIVKDELVRELP